MFRHKGEDHLIERTRAGGFGLKSELTDLASVLIDFAIAPGKKANVPDRHVIGGAPFDKMYEAVRFIIGEDGVANFAIKTAAAKKTRAALLAPNTGIRRDDCAAAYI